MRIQPVSKSAPSPIPTAAEAAANPALIEPASAGRTRRGLGALVGAGLLGSLLAPAVASAQDAAAPTAEPATASAVPDSADTEAAARAEAAREAVATVVAPILQKALDEEGRGAFGCLAIDPPMMLSEAEALGLIEQEFEKAGVKLRRNVEISDFMRTVPDKAQQPLGDKKHLWMAQYPAKTVRKNWTFDLATEDGSVVLEYLSTQDGIRESFEAYRSTVNEYDFPELAQRFRSDFASRTDGHPVTIGLFFDPLASNSVWDEKQQKRILRPGSSIAALSEEERKTLDWAKEKELLQNDAREMLREQVRFFLDWARKEGKIPLNGDPT